MKQLYVNAGNGSEIVIEKGILSACGSRIRAVSKAEKACIISDSNVYPLYGETVNNALCSADFDVSVFVFPAGEGSKTTTTVVQMTEFLAEKEFTRKDLVVALGGGVTGDMAGLAAALYLRGIPFVQIPTSLLAQVDSSVGGKTAVDLPQGKNLFGAFHQPSLVLIDADTLDTLPPHYFADGMAEAIKMGCIKSKSLFEKIETNDAHSIIEDIIYECVSLKAAVVERDEREQGERALLNFGHTAGHAIEKLHGFTTISHGEAVGIGMVLICKAAEANGLTENGCADRIAAVLRQYGLLTQDSHTVSEIVAAMRSDKKRAGSAIKLVLLHGIGDSFLYPVAFDVLPAWFGCEG